MEEKNCENCYWKFYLDPSWCCWNDEKPKESVCKEHKFKCECGDKAEYKYHDKLYCLNCILGEFGVETVYVKKYCLDGEYIAGEDDIRDEIENMDDDIEFIEK